MWSLSTSFRELWVHWLCSVAEWQPKLLPISQPNSYALFLCLHISLSIILESAFWDPSLGRLKQKLSTSKNRDTGLAYGSSSLFPLILFSLEGNTFRKEKRRWKTNLVKGLHSQLCELEGALKSFELSLLYWNSFSSILDSWSTIWAPVQTSPMTLWGYLVHCRTILRFLLYWT